ncbi:sigma-54 dependent transcriptional regulator [Desulfovibrio sp. JY]|nr:sigma-54 dependent transcriptional regulator [Desulfovibrio sp. JY]
MDTPLLYAKLTQICEAISRGEYEQAKAVFDLPPGDGQANPGNVLAEALGMMLVRIEAREFELGRAITELTATREELVWHKDRLAHENSRLRAELRRKSDGARPVASAPAMLQLMRQAERAALVDANLLITGETGTGKGVFARHIHAMSQRAGKPFIPINCAAIPASLLESELFGIEAGVASGVQARIGRFEQAAGGAILLDEIGDMPLESQAKLLHVIETGVVERVGGRKPISVGVRIMAATHRDLERRVAEGSFRADLFYRLNVMRLHIPPLRERREDIPLLARLFLARLAERSPFAASIVAPAALKLLLAHCWPGNIRELENELERSALLAEGPAIGPGDLSPLIGMAAPLEDDCAVSPERSRPDMEDEAAAAQDARIATLAEVESAHIRTVLDRMGGNKSKTAQALGISREGLRVKLERTRANHGPQTS